MRVCWKIFSLGLVTAIAYSALLSGQDRPSSKQTEGRAATFDSAKSQNAASVPAGTSESSSITTPLPSQDSSQAESMFDALRAPITGPVTEVEVHARVGDSEIGEPFRTGGKEILSTAGSFGDIERFLQVLPGVVSTSDVTNEVVVRGGDPMENLFLIDGIEVPNINHMAVLGTTGGFGPMIDAAAVQGLTLYTGGYDALYPERLSSVIKIETLNPKHLSTHVEVDAGIQGVGGLIERQIRGNDLLVSAHKGFLQWFQSAGIGGLPAYQNELVRFRRSSPSGSQLTVLHVAGMDSVESDPCPLDPHATSNIDSQYSGWRETTGVEWQHVYSKSSFGIASVSDSEQIERVYQQDQSAGPTNSLTYTAGCPNQAASVAPPLAYWQHSNEAFSNASYRFEWSGSRIAASAGSAFWLERPNYRIEQPIGTLSPYSVAPVRSDSTSFASGFSTGQSGTFAQLTIHPFSKLAFTAGGRAQTFALGGHATLTPRLSVRFDPNERVGFHVAFATYEQLPPYVYLLSYPQNRGMVPMRATHEIAGVDLNPGLGSQIRIEGYKKIYSNIPASSEYPAINLHDIVEMLGNQIVWMPMNSGGRGNASGIEVSDITRIGSRLTMRASVAYSRATFAGLDGVRRPSNYDLPWITNFAGIQRLGRGYELSARFGYATGRPYTPFDLSDSSAQNRAIYDVSRMNALRAPYFARFDAQLNKDFTKGGLHLQLYMGANNILNRANFMSYVWLPNAWISSTYIDPVYEIHQMPIIPNFGLRYILR
jgi:hypothetical protein